MHGRDLRAQLGFLKAEYERGALIGRSRLHDAEPSVQFQRNFGTQRPGAAPYLQELGVCVPHASIGADLRAPCCVHANVDAEPLATPMPRIEAQISVMRLLVFLLPSSVPSAARGRVMGVECVPAPDDAD